MKKLLLCLLLVTTLVACGDNKSNTDTKNVTTNGTVTQNKDVTTNTETKVSELIFGSAYGMCQGEACVETYRLTNNALFEDKTDDYNHASFDFHQLDNEAFAKAKTLLSEVPNAMWNTPVGRVGCPDCADGGGIFVQYTMNGETKSWFIDNNLSQVPSELHKFVEAVKSTIAKINNQSVNTSDSPLG